MYWYKSILENNGFEIENIEANGNYFSYICQELLRLPSVTKQYTMKQLGLFDFLAIYKLVTKMKKINRGANESDELLCYGYHVVAKKVD